MNKIFFSIPILFLSLLGCSTKLDDQSQFKIPVEKFVFIEQEMTLNFCSMMDPNICYRDSITNSASGALVGMDYLEETSFILTAAHVCKTPEVPSLPELTKNGILTTIEDYRFIANNYLGERLDATPIKNNQDNDLCLMRINSLSVEPLELSEQDPQPLDRIKTISAPAASWDPNAINVFDGRFNGTNRNNLSVYSIPSYPGSSGAPILNEENKLIGIISFGLSDSWIVGYGARREDIESFLEEVRLQ